MSDRVHTFLVIACAILMAAPVVVAAYPPMTDLAHHEGLVGLLRFFGDTAMFPPGLYVRNLGHPNQLFHLLAWPLSYVVGVTLACKLVAGGAVAGVVLGGVRFARHVGASPLTAMALAPLALGWLFTWGFVTNLLGLASFFALLPTLDRLAKAPTLRSVAAATGGAIVLYFAHELMLLVFLGGAALFALLTARSVRGLAARLVPVATTFAIVVAQLTLQEKLKTTTARRVPDIWTSVTSKLAEIPSVLVGGVDRSLRGALVLLVALLVASFVVVRVRAERAPPRASEPDAGSSLTRLQQRLAPYRFEIFAAATFVLYLIAPFTFNGAMLVHERFLAPAFGIAAVMAGARVRAQWPSLALGVLTPIVSLVAVLPWFADSSANYRMMETLFAQIPLGRSVAAIDLDANQGGRPFSVASGLSRVLARRGGRVLYSFVESPIAPVLIDSRYEWDESSARITLDNPKFRPGHDLTRFQYLLVHAMDPRRLTIAAAALQREAAFVDSVGEWALFVSKLPVVPLLSPDAPLPDPRPETMGRRMWFLERGETVPLPDSPPSRQDAKP